MTARAESAQQISGACSTLFRPCRLCYRYDGAVYRAVAAEFQQASAGGSRRIFQGSVGASKKVGTNLVGSGENFSLSKDNMPKLKEELQKSIRQMKDFEKLKNQIEITITAQGLRIELLESDTGTFFNSGRPNPTDKGTELLAMLAAELGKLPNRISIEGHTDSKPYVGARDYGNWELSADRANAARRLMQRDGLGPNQVSQVRGFANQELRKKEDPLDASNRRITLIVQYIVRDADQESPERVAPPEGAKPAIGKSEEKSK